MVLFLTFQFRVHELQDWEWFHTRKTPDRPHWSFFHFICFILFHWRCMFENVWQKSLRVLSHVLCLEFWFCENRIRRKFYSRHIYCLMDVYPNKHTDMLTMRQYNFEHAENGCEALPRHRYAHLFQYEVTCVLPVLCVNHAWGLCPTHPTRQISCHNGKFMQTFPFRSY